MTTQDKPAEFVRCLITMSGARASWDCYDRSAAAKAEGDRAEAQALNRAREIWRDNPDMHDELRAAFVKTQPLATMSEIERAPL
jgi:hypothetical protein